MKSGQLSELWRIFKTILMQDSTVLHFSFVDREWLEANFFGRGMGRWSPHTLPARISDLTPSDFFLSWGWLKEQVYSTKPQEF